MGHWNKGFDMHHEKVLQHLKKHGQLLDSEIAQAVGIKLAEVRTSIATLAEMGEIAQCSVTRFEKGKPIEQIQCRVRGFSPPAAPGRKSAAK